MARSLGSGWTSLCQSIIGKRTTPYGLLSSMSQVLRTGLQLIPRKLYPAAMQLKAHECSVLMHLITAACSQLAPKPEMVIGY